MTWTMGCPGYGVHLSIMAFQSFYCFHGVPEIKNHHIIGPLLDASKVKHVPLVPSNSKQWLLIRALVYNCASLEVSQVKMPNGAIFKSEQRS